MPSPFPGMDPYLECYWEDVHLSLTTSARDSLNSELPAALIARAEEYGVDGFDELGELFGRLPQHAPSPERKARVSSFGRLDPQALVLPITADQPTDCRIRIIDHLDAERLITSIEFLSLTNKFWGVGEYERKQRELIEAGVNLVEIDLLRDGPWVVAAPEHLVPAKWRSPYKVSVLQADPRRCVYYRCSYRERLPVVHIPLRPTDPPATLDLQALVDLAYKNGRYDFLDYSREPFPELSPTDARWVDDFLRQQGRRK